MFEGVYGTQGESTSSTVPRCRIVPSGTVDPSGNLWVFGGFGVSGESSGDMNDLWLYEAELEPPESSTTEEESSSEEPEEEEEVKEDGTPVGMIVGVIVAAVVVICIILIVIIVVWRRRKVTKVHTAPPSS